MRISPLFALLLAAAPALVGQTPDRQLAFAESLRQEGNEAFALLEFKRFVFHNPRHHQAPEALFRIAGIYLTYVNDMNAAKATLKQVAADYPQTEAGRKSKEFVEFIEVNSDFGGKPLTQWLVAKAAEDRGAADVAVQGYADLANHYPKARLADDAVVRRARLLLEKLDKPGEARTEYEKLVRQYPKSPFLAEAYYYRAVAIHKTSGPSQETVAAYRNVAQRFPKSDYARQADQQLAQLEKQLFVIKRQFDPQYAREFKQAAERRLANRYEVDIEVPIALSEREVKATLEQALIKHSETRAEPKDAVVVTAFFNHPFTKAGRVEWTPGETPSYQVEKQETEDVLKDVFIDLLKRR